MHLKIISFNLRFDKPDPGEQNWRRRRSAIATLLKEYAPDLIGTQEGLAHQLLDLHRLLPQYQSVGGDRVGTGTDEYCAIFYRSERLECVETGDFFLSDTPEVPGSISPGWGNPAPRMATWAAFAVAGEAKKTALFNTHLDYHSAKARELGARAICDYLQRLQLEDYYFFATGDFNATPDSLPRETFKQPLANNLQLNDALAGVAREQQVSFHDFTGTGFIAVDTIYYDSRVSLQMAKVDTLRWQGVLPSDHFPVIGEFTSE